METPSWALSVSFWLHMLATVSWVGGQAVISLLIIPIGRKMLSGDAFSNFMAKINQRMRSIAWVSFTVLIATGLIQISADQAHDGFLSLQTNWGVAILIKLLVFGGILALTAYQTWGLSPIIERSALLQSRGKNIPVSMETLHKRENITLWINFSLSIIVLLLTAIARIS
ncbi:MAG: CopD family protein [Anaerolineales bacterium]